MTAHKVQTRLLQLAIFGTLGVAGWLLVSQRAEVATDTAPPSDAPAPQQTRSTPVPSNDDAPRNAPARPSTSEQMPMIGGGVSKFARTWDALNLDEVRREMPDNLVWKLTAPTEDPAVLEERKHARQYWQKLYGKVNSNTASVKEVNEYYAHQQQRSADYIEFTSYVIDRHGEELPEQDLKLLHLAQRMHTARLQEIPKRQADALARQQAHTKAREAWLAEQGRSDTDSSEADTEETETSSND